MKWRRYRFYTNSVEDYRPLIFNPKYPYWCTGYGVGNDFKCSSAIIVAYLPKGEDLYKYWDDAYNVDEEERDEITFTDRFPKPDYFVES